MPRISLLSTIKRTLSGELFASRWFRRVLYHGIRNTRDLSYAMQLISQVSPHWGRRIVEAAKGIPIEITSFSNLPAGHIRHGATDFTVTRSIDRNVPEKALKIELGKGEPLFTLLHELTHAVSVDALPADRSAPEVKRQGSISEIYKSILENKYWDEALAFYSMDHLARDFYKATGVHLFTCGAHQDFSDRQAVADASNRGGEEGVLKWVKANKAYFSYKIAALQLAIMLKMGAAELPHWDKILEEIGISSGASGIVSIDPQKLRAFYEQVLQPLMQKKGAGLLSVAANVGGEDREKLTRAMLFFTGMLSFDESNNFLEKDFDRLVELLAEMMGERESLPAAPQPAQACAVQLPLRPLPMPAGNPAEFVTRPEALANKARLVGTYVHLLHRLYRVSDEEIICHWEAYLKYAELCDPISSSRIYSKLLALANKMMAELVADPKEQSGGGRRRSVCQLGISLCRAGYKQEGEALLKFIFKNDFRYHFWEEKNINRLVEAGRADLLVLGVDERLNFAEEDMLAFEKQAADPPHILPQREETAHHLVHEFFRVCESFNEVNLAQMPAGVKEKLQAFAKRVWEAEAAWVRNRKLAHPKEYPIEGEDALEYPVSPFKFIEKCLACPLLFDYGLELLQAYPTGFSKTLLYQHALSTKSAVDLPEARKLSLAESYLAVLDSRELVAWHTYVQKYRQAVLEREQAWDRHAGENIYERNLFCFCNERSEPAEKLHWEHISAVAHYLIKSASPVLKEKGKRLLEGLSESPKPLRFSSEYGHPIKVELEPEMHLSLEYPEFRPAMWKAISLLKSIPHLMPQERETALNKVLDLLQINHTTNESSIRGWEAYAELTKLAVKYGYTAFADRLLTEWGATEQRLSASVEGARRKIDLGIGNRWVVTTSRLRGTDSMLRAVNQLAAGDPQLLEQFIENVRVDVARKRSQYSLECILEATKLLTSEEMTSRLGHHAAAVTELAKLAVDAFVLSTGIERDLYRMTDRFEPVVETLRDLPIDDEQKDEIFCYLIERATPEDGVNVQKNDTPFWQGIKVLDFILGNAVMPASESILLERMVRVASSRDPMRKDTEDLTWIYQRLAVATVLDPKTRLQLDQLKAEPEYQAAVDHIFSFLDQWQTASATIASNNPADYKAEYAILSDEKADLAMKRKAFARLKEAKIYSDYALRKWEKLVDSEDKEREAIFYAITSPCYEYGQRIKFTPDDMVALALDLPVEEARCLVERYQRFQQTTEWRWQMDIGNPHDWEIYASCCDDDWEGSLAAIFESLVCMCQRIDDFSLFFHGDWWKQEVEIRGYVAQAGRCFPGYRRDLAVGRSLNPNRLEDVARKIDHYLLPQEAAPLLRHFQAIVDRKIRNRDSVKMELFEMPDLFKNRDPLTQFLLSRFYMEYPTGEQQDLMLGLRDAKPETALRVFFEKTGMEKVGQFLSFWPTVPEAVRAELRSLQDRVAPSGLDEVRKTIRDQLRPGAETDAILANLEPTPLGSGTIGECYLSRLSNGQRVVVKVIPPSKEKNFRKGLTKAKAVQKLLRAYLEELPGAKEAFRFMEMYFGMVRDELDLRKEAENAAELRPILQVDGIDLPEYYPALTSAKVAVLSYVEGVKISDVQDPQRRAGIMEKIGGNFFARQVMETGCYQCDIHPGNILVDEKKSAEYVIDFGQVGHLSDEERGKIAAFLASFVSNDPTAIRTAIEKMGRRKRDYRADELEQSISRLLGAWNGDMNAISPIISQLFQACYQSNLWIDLPYLQLVKGLATLEAAVRDTTATT